MSVRGNGDKMIGAKKYKVEEDKVRVVLRDTNEEVKGLENEVKQLRNIINSQENNNESPCKCMRWS